MKARDIGKPRARALASKAISKSVTEQVEELRSCVKEEIDILVSLSLIVHMISLDVK